MPVPGDQTRLKTAEVLSTKQHHQRILWYHVFEFIIGLVFYTPNFQSWRQNDQNLSTKQYTFLITGSFMLLHSISNIMILLYKTLTDSDFIQFDILTTAQKKLLGLADSTKTSNDKVLKTPTKTNQHNCSLFSPNLPTIDEPLIDDKLLSPIQTTPKKSSNLKNSPNRSALSQSTLELINWKHNTSHTSLLKDTSAYIMDDSNVEDLLNSSSWGNKEIYSEDDELPDSQTNLKNQSNISQNLSFYTNKSFLNSFDEKTSPNKNRNQNLDAWTNNSSFHIVDKNAVKKTISEQLYRTCTPPTSPSKLDMLMGDGNLKKTNSDPSDKNKLSSGDMKIGSNKLVINDKYRTC